MEEIQKNKHYYKVNHRYREKIIVPIIAITHNVNFIMDSGDIYVITADEVKCKVTNRCIRNIFELEKDIKNIYDMSAWDFLKKWYGVNESLSSIDFFVLQLKKEE